MTKQFILDTLLPYKQDPTTCAVDKDGYCCYLTDDGKKCAVGKHLIEGEHQSSFSNVNGLFNAYGYEEILTKEAKEQNIPVYVWAKMQHYHDCLGSDFNKDNANLIVKELEKLTGFEFPELMFE